MNLITKSLVCVLSTVLICATQLPSSQAATLFKTKAECEAAIFVGSPTKDSGAVYNPCSGHSLEFVWGQSVTTNRACANTGAGIWQLYVSQQYTVTRAIFSSSGKNANGILFCTATAYDSTYKTTKTAWNPNTRVFDTCTDTETNTPVVYNQTNAWIAAYGTPTLWRYTNYSLTSTCPGVIQIPTVPFQQQEGVSPWLSNATP